MQSPHLLVLDLDETLIYADTYPLNRPPDFEVSPYSIYLRPGLHEFLLNMSSIFKLAVWTSSSPLYASAICAKIFDQKYPLEFIWASDRCTQTRDFSNDSWSQAKHLSKLKRKGFDLNRIIMVDDSPEKHRKNYGNLVQAAPYSGNTDDNELNLLTIYLKQIATVQNIRALEKRRWRHQIQKFETLTQSS